MKLIKIPLLYLLASQRKYYRNFYKHRILFLWQAINATGLARTAFDSAVTSYGFEQFSKMKKSSLRPNTKYDCTADVISSLEV